MRQSLQKTLDQQRAADAWMSVSNCLDDAIQALETAIQELEEAIQQERDDEQKKALQKRRDDFQKKLNSLRTEKGGSTWRKEYCSLARRVPMLVLTNGLGQTLAFLRSKGKDDPSDEHNILFDHLSRWTMSQVAPNVDNQNLLDWVLNNDSTAYRRATTEALAYLNWLKRFAEAELPTEEG